MRRKRELAQRLAAAEQVIAAGIIAFEHTQDYVGHEALPNIDGWSHWDWRRRAGWFLGDGWQRGERPTSVEP